MMDIFAIAYYLSVMVILANLVQIDHSSLVSLCRRYLLFLVDKDRSP
jgi:hypothetical protein